MSLAKNVEFLRHLSEAERLQWLGCLWPKPCAWLAQPAGRDQRIRYQSRRAQDVLVRSGASRSAVRALVVVLHGCGQTAAGYDLGAGWSTLAKRYGFALLMPEQQAVEQRQHLLQLVQSGRHRARSRRSLLDPADDRAHGRRSQTRSAPHLRHRTFRRRRDDVGDARDLSGSVRRRRHHRRPAVRHRQQSCAKRSTA